MATFLLGFILAAALVPSRGDGGDSNLVGGLASQEAGSGTPGVAVTPGDPAAQPGASVEGALDAGAGGDGAASVDATGGAPADPAATTVPGSPTDAGAPPPAAGAPAADAGDAPAAGQCPSGGATATGVTESKVTVAVLASSTETLRPVYGNRAAQGGQQTDKNLVKGVTDRWRREGRLPVCGRDLDFVYAETRSLEETSLQAACENLAARKPFVALGPAPTGGGTALCMSGQFKIPTILAQGALTEDQLQQMYPLAWDAGPATSRSMRNWAHWLKANGYLDKQVLGLYAPNDPRGLMDPFRKELQRLGYKLAVDFEMTSNNGGDSALAVAQFRQAGVTVALIYANLSEPKSFQTNAAAQGYHPKYPQADFGNFALIDAIVDLSYNVNEQHGNKGMAVRFWDWTARKPATPKNNAAAAQCLADYKAATGRAPSTYDDDALLAYILDECTILEILIDALHNAGSNLSIESLVTGISQIRNKQTAEYLNVTFGPRKLSGSDVYNTAEFNKARWQPENHYWKTVGTWRPFWVQ